MPTSPYSQPAQRQSPERRITNAVRPGASAPPTRPPHEITLLANPRGFNVRPACEQAAAGGVVARLRETAAQPREKQSQKPHEKLVAAVKTDHVAM
jgi:hypothetical protein